MADQKSSKGSVIVKQVRSAIGHPERQRSTLKSLGLGKIGQTAEHTFTPSVAGMVRSISHLVQIEERGSK